MLKNGTINKLYESAKEDLEVELQLHDEAEIVFVPIVVAKNKGKIATIKGVNTGIIFKNEI